MDNTSSSVIRTLAPVFSITRYLIIKIEVFVRGINPVVRLTGIPSTRIESHPHWANRDFSEYKPNF